MEWLAEKASRAKSIADVENFMKECKAPIYPAPPALEPDGHKAWKEKMNSWKSDCLDALMKRQLLQTFSLEADAKRAKLAPEMEPWTAIVQSS